MACETYFWEKQAEGKEIFTGENSQIRTMIIERDDREISGVLTIRKWARYVKKDERELGLTLDEAEFRPTKDGLSLPLSSVTELIEELQKLEKWAKAEGYIEE